MPELNEHAVPPPPPTDSRPRAWLRVRAGLHRGAAVALHAGRWRVGSSIDDDIVLRDALVEPGHLQIVVSADALRFEAVAPGWQQGDSALEPGTQRELAVARRAGPATLCLGDAMIELAWAEAFVAAGPSSWWQRVARVAADPRRRMPMALAGVAAFGGVVALALTLRGAIGPNLQTAPRADPMEAAQQRIGERAEWKNLMLARAPSQQVELRGRVEQRDALASLLRAPEVLALAPAVRVLVGDDVRSQIHEVLGDSSIAVSIENAPADAGGRPSVVVSGTTNRVSAADSLRLLKNELADRVELVDRTIYEPSAGDRKTVRVELPIRIGSVNVAEGYVESVDGAKFFEGSVISGYEIQSIEDRRVVFNVSGKRIEFPVP
jgi:Inner membrane component of T3SS, cytoplasmic domain